MKHRKYAITHTFVPIGGGTLRLAQVCGDVRGRCKEQRERMHLQLVALRLRADWHALPKNVRNEFFTQLVIDRAARRLVESVNDSADG